jgi:hypothetical protein
MTKLPLLISELISSHLFLQILIFVLRDVDIIAFLAQNSEPIPRF